MASGLFGYFRRADQEGLMPIYDKPTKQLMHEFAAEMLKPEQIFDKKDAVTWFAQRYPKIQATTVQMHVEGMATNSNVRKHHKSIKLGSGHDLFFKVAPGQFRLWNPGSDPEPLYPSEFSSSDPASAIAQSAAADADEEVPPQRGSTEFAYERDLRNYLAKNLSLLERGLKLFEDEEFSDVEFPVGGRFIDILAVDSERRYVVIELKVSRGYDRVVGQLLRYMGWIKANMSDGGTVRGIIVANEASDDLKLAVSLVPNVGLFQYELALKISPVGA